MIQVQDLHFSYNASAHETLHGLNFGIGKGEIFGFLGPSGAGKSTTQKILTGLLKRYSGSVKVGNKEIRQITPDFYEKVGVVFEFPNLFSKFTALENLSYFSGLYRGATWDLKELLALVGLEKDMKTRVSEFSKGMKMRLNFCRGLLNIPEVLFLDEPTSGLDPVNARGILEIIKTQKQAGTTIFLTTHNMHVADELCDRVAFIIDGRIVLIDSPRTLKLQKGKKKIKVESRSESGIITEEFAMDGIGENTRFQELLKSGKLETIHSLEASLEDIFIEVTGRRLV